MQTWLNEIRSGIVLVPNLLGGEFARRDVVFFKFWNPDSSVENGAFVPIKLRIML
jgi:hypothetical protein